MHSVISNEVFPMHPGYALGGLISAANLLVPYYEKEFSNLEKALATIRAEKVAIKASEISDKQSVVNSLAIKILQLEKKINEINEKIRCLKETGYMGIPIEESLPLDNKYVRVINEARAFKSETLRNMVFRSKDALYYRVHTFVSKLFLQDATFLPVGMLEGMAKDIERMLNEGDSDNSLGRKEETEVHLVGAFITLEKVKMVDPIVLRPNYRPSQELLKKKENYYVLTEAVLGGVFLGLGQSTKTSNADDVSIDRIKNLSFSSLSIFSQGAIANTERQMPNLSQGPIQKSDEVLEIGNLFEIYNRWKNSLSQDPESGYPIGFKVRKLTDVLEECGIR